MLGLKAAFAGLGIEAAGRALVENLGSQDESVRTQAGDFLVQSGPKAVPLLLEALQGRKHVPLVLARLGEIADPATIPIVERFTRDPQPETARAAREALAVAKRLLEIRRVAQPPESR